HPLPRPRGHGRPHAPARAAAARRGPHGLLRPPPVAAARHRQVLRRDRGGRGPPRLRRRRRAPAARDGHPRRPRLRRPAGQGRGRLGLHVDGGVLLVMAGGLDADDLEGVLAPLVQLRWPLDVEVVTGRSQRLARVAERYADTEGPVRLRVHGFVTDVPLRMAAADIALTKPGGLTCSEALAAGLPLLLVSPYPLHEEANATVLLENGAALRVEPLSTLSFKLRRLLAERDRLERMRS